MVTSVICLLISCAIILLKEKSNYPDNHLLMTYLVILLFAVMAISIKACGGWMLFFFGLTWYELCDPCGCGEKTEIMNENFK